MLAILPQHSYLSVWADDSVLTIFFWCCEYDIPGISALRSHDLPHFVCPVCLQNITYVIYLYRSLTDPMFQQWNIIEAIWFFLLSALTSIPVSLTNSKVASGFQHNQTTSLQGSLEFSWREFGGSIVRMDDIASIFSWLAHRPVKSCGQVCGGCARSED